MPWYLPTSQSIGFDEVYPRLRRIAGDLVSRESSRTMQGTELLHEALISLCDYRGLVTNSSHYISLTVGAMKRVLINRSRRRDSQKRTPDNSGSSSVQPECERVMAMRVAFHRLHAYDREVGEAVQLHFFEGYTLAESSVRMKVSVSRVRQLVAFGEAWLRNEFISTPATRPDAAPIPQLR